MTASRKAPGKPRKHPESAPSDLVCPQAKLASAKGLALRALGEDQRVGSPEEPGKAVTTPEFPGFRVPIVEEGKPGNSDWAVGDGDVVRLFTGEQQGGSEDPSDGDVGECPCPDCEPPRYRYAGREQAHRTGGDGTLARRAPAQGDRMRKVVYIAHAFACDPAGNVERVRRIAEGMKHDCAVIAPHLMLPHFIDEATERPLALAHCLRLVAAADEVRVYGEPTEGMALEIAEARRLGIPVVFTE